MDYDSAKLLKLSGFPQRKEKGSFYLDKDTGEYVHRPTLEELMTEIYFEIKGIVYE